MTQTEAGAVEVTPSEVVARRVKEVRTRRGMSARVVAERCQSVGLRMDRSVLASLESGRRESVSVDELLTLAYVLDVAPIHLLVPMDEAVDGDGREVRYRFTPRLSAFPVAVRAWMRGEFALPGGDRRSYFAEVPESEYQEPEPAAREAQRVRQVQQLTTVYNRLFDGGDGQH